jgi:hypothetical protein
MPGVVRADGGSATAVRRAVTFLAVTVAVAVALAIYRPTVAAGRGWITVPALATPVVSALGTLAVCTAVAALVVRLHTEGVVGVTAGFRAVTIWRVGRRWWAVALLCPYSSSVGRTERTCCWGNRPTVAGAGAA